MKFTSTSRKLAQGVLELGISLGQKTAMAQEEHQVPEKWQVTLEPNSLARTNQRYIQTVEEAGVTGTTCITVDSPSGLFLAGREMVPTHNTKIAVDLMDEMETRRTLVLAPLSVVDHVWPGEIRKHSGRPNLTVVSLGNRVPSTRKKLERAAEGLKLATARRGPAVVIVNYESAWRKPLGAWLKDQHWDLLIMDESHRIKNASGETSRFVSQLSDRSQRRLALTGTPMPHSPLDIYAQYRAIDKTIFGVDHREFTNRYAEFETTSRPTTFINRQGKEETRPGRKVSGYQNLDELHQKFYQLAFRVTAAETLDLPSAIETYTKVELNGKTRKLYDQMAASFRAELETGETMTAANALARLTRFQQLTSGFAVTPEGKVMEVDDSKQNALADILEDLPMEERLVVFARFQHDLDSIAQVSEKAKRSCYEISGRAKNLDEWNRNGGVLAVQLQAGGLGLDLTQARYCVYYSLSFSLGDYLQSIARLHRHGQTRMVDYIHLVAHESIDEIITVALERKEDIIKHILEVRDLTNRDPEK